MPRCTAYNCTHITRRANAGDNGGVSLFKFPKKEKLCQLWIQALGRDDLNEFTSSQLKSLGLRVCQLHFKKDDVYEKESKHFLRKNAVPITTSKNRKPKLNVNEKKVTDELPQENFVDETTKELGPATPVNPLSRLSVQELRDSLCDVDTIWYCAVPMCNNNSRQHPHLGFHSLNSNQLSKMTTCNEKRVIYEWKYFLEETMKLWKFELKNQIITSQEYKICSVHFKSSLFDIQPDLNRPGKDVKLKISASPCYDPVYSSYVHAKRRLDTKRPLVPLKFIRENQSTCQDSTAATSNSLVIPYSTNEDFFPPSNTEMFQHSEDTQSLEATYTEHLKFIKTLDLPQKPSFSTFCKMKRKLAKSNVAPTSAYTSQSSLQPSKNSVGNTQFVFMPKNGQMKHQQSCLNSSHTSSFSSDFPSIKKLKFVQAHELPN